MGIFNMASAKQGENPAAQNAVKNWYQESYEAVMLQRNLMFCIGLLSSFLLLVSVLMIRYIKNSKSISPFVIEIEEKTGVPTVVEPVSVEAYSAQEAVRRYFISKYVKAREEYQPFLYSYNYNTVVRVLSSLDVYRNDYRPKYNENNPESPVNQLGQGGSRSITIKSIIFPADKTAQVRFSVRSTGSISDSGDKVALVYYDFVNIRMDEEERMINPLGFQVMNYKVDDERIG